MNDIDTNPVKQKLSQVVDIRIEFDAPEVLWINDILKAITIDWGGLGAEDEGDIKVIKIDATCQWEDK